MNKDNQNVMDNAFLVWAASVSATIGDDAFRTLLDMSAEELRVLRKFATVLANTKDRAEKLEELRRQRDIRIEQRREELEELRRKYVTEDRPKIP